jgi:hypothetical protein
VQYRLSQLALSEYDERPIERDKYWKEKKKGRKFNIQNYINNKEYAL